MWNRHWDNKIEICDLISDLIRHESIIGKNLLTPFI